MSPWNEQLNWEQTLQEWQGNLPPWGGNYGEWGTSPGGPQPGEPGGPQIPDWHWPLTKDLDPDAGDMGAFGLARQSDRYFINSSLQWEIARRTGKQMWYPSDPSDATGFFTLGTVTLSPYDWGVAGLQNQTALLDNTETKMFATLQTCVIGETWRGSFYVRRGDGGVPVLGTDFAVVMDGASFGSGRVDHVSGDVYRASAVGVVATGGSRPFGVSKTAGESAEPIYCSGYQFVNLG